MPRDASLDIAVTGMATRFPGPRRLSDWWGSVLAGDVMSAWLNRDEVLARGVPPQWVENDWVPVVSEAEDMDRFDHEHFGLSPREAQLMDPQHRVALEVAWAALEDACVAPGDGDDRRTAVFSSMTGSGYLRAVCRAANPDPALLDDLVHGCEPEFLASRVSYKLGLRGPAVAVQTACSSTLVGLHLATQALLAGDCDQAVVVGTGLAFPGGGYQYHVGGILSPDGVCRPFSASANGVVGGSGAAAVVLRRAEDLGTDDPPAHGVVLATATNNDGAAKAGFYAPSPEGQRQVILAALAAAEVDARSIGFLQSHGTGTALGDPIEWSAASSAYRQEGAQPGQIAVGAIKANIGHLDACAGLAGLVTALLVVRDGTIPPLAGYAGPNPQLELIDSPLRVPTVSESWTPEGPRRAAVSAFGIGGTNAHVVVEQATSRAPVHPDTSRPVVLALSARDEPTLDRLTDELAEALTGPGSPGLGDAAHTLTSARASFSYRRAVVAQDPRRASEDLRARAGLAGTAPGRGLNRQVILVMPGQGTQRPGMARPYLDALPGFGYVLEQVLDGLADVGEEGAASRAEVSTALLDQASDPAALSETRLAQPAIVGLQVAIVEVLRQLELDVAAVLGHSLGEISAAFAAGILSSREAVEFAARRGAAMQVCSGGLMMALGCSELDAEALIAGSELEVAAVNGPASSTVAGPTDAVRALADRLPGTVFHRVLATTRAFHSRLMDTSLQTITEASAAWAGRRLEVAMATGRDGVVVPVGQPLADTYFSEAARHPVRFADAVDSVTAMFPDAVVVEVGPGRALAPLLMELGTDAVSLGAPPAGGPVDVLHGVASLWVRGAGIDLAAVTAGGAAVHLPGYAFKGPVHLAAELAGSGAQPLAEPPVPREQVDDRPSSETGPLDAEAVMGEAWCALLGRDDVSPTDDFFQLGGDSLLVIRLIRAVDAAVGIRLSPRDLMLAGTFAKQVEVLERAVATPVHR